MTVAIYPGTFDPITYGHMDIVKRAAGLFDQVIVAVAAYSGKQTLFSVPERVTLIQQALAGLSQVTVLAFDNLLVDFAKVQQASIIIRGLRAVSDLDYEFQLARMNQQLADGLETLFLMPAEQYAYLSSTLIREVARLHGDIDAFVHPAVASAMRTKFKE
ncbi:MAG: pantetheine-phosphate adenylyltransferase [Legionellales bacterium]|nr:pantetheine-phosphate adenylyltransferase [Legionellales bacterium]